MKKLNVEGSLKKDKFEAEAPIQVDKVQLTMNLVIRLTFPHPMKLKREIKGHEVIVLIHCRATQFYYGNICGEVRYCNYKNNGVAI